MSVARTSGSPVRRPRYRLRRFLAEVASVILGVALLIWSLAPVYNMLLIALDRDEGDIEFEGLIWPPDPSLHSFQAVLTQGYWLVEDFWHQFGNSFFIGLMTMFLTVLTGSLASFAFSRMRLSNRVAAPQCSAPHVRGPGILPGHPVLSTHGKLRAFEYPVGDHRGKRDVRYPICHLDPAPVRQVDTHLNSTRRRGWTARPLFRCIGASICR